MRYLETQLWFLWAASPLYPLDRSLNYEFELCSGPPLVCWVRPPQIVLNPVNVREVVVLHRAAPNWNFEGELCKPLYSMLRKLTLASAGYRP